MRPSGYRWTLLNYWFPYHAFHALGGVIGVKEWPGTPPGAEHIPCLILSSTFFDSRRWGFAVYRLVEKIALLLNSGAGPGRYFAVTSNSHDCFGFFAQWIQVTRVVLMGRSGLDFILLEVRGLEGPIPSSGVTGP
ncbi:hypothetical protein OIU84_019223 [Salix udensis]|uniref:Uncharacterized protein n=1 Tax=Salix udensis TaxID=889485 RepID=A0AAD6KYD3_9ROSI|nr:hypothetical protein OIU84_019223 [Salix udensis]